MNVLLINASAKQDGATGEILRILAGELAQEGHLVERICLGEVEISHCVGCLTCYRTGTCVKTDGVNRILEKMAAAEAILIAAPSYWGDVPGIFKTLIDRCTPYADTNPLADHPRLSPGKRGYAVALRTGGRPGECTHILDCVRHWCGHMGVSYADGAYFCGIRGREDIEQRREEVRALARKWF